MNEDQYLSPTATEISQGAPQRWMSWRWPASIVLCLTGTGFLLLLDGQTFTNSLVFLFCWITSLIIWLPELWKSRYGVPGRLVVVLGLHVVAMGFVCLCLRDSYEHQKGFNEAVKAAHDWHRASETHDPRNGAGDPVSSVTKDETSETTTFRRDGKTILKSILYHPTEPQGRILLQRVIFHDQVVIDLSDCQGKRAFVIHPLPHVSVGIQQDASTGELEGVGLMDDAHGVIERFAAKESRLIPVSGKQLDLERAVTKDVSGLLAPDSVKQTTPEDFEGRVKKLVKKYKTEKSAPQEDYPVNDKPPQDPASSRKP